ncbi:MAG: 4-hydroxyphenylpyruvate dioxygenase [Candidatus Neomarinimicrobiota bacterium]
MTEFAIEAFDHVSFYVSNAKQASHFYRWALGFQPVGYQGLETGSRDKTSYVMKQNDITFVLTSPLDDTGPVGEHIKKHGDGVKDVAFRVDNAQAAWEVTMERGAESAYDPYTLEDDNGKVTLSGIKAYGDTIHSFVQRHDYHGLFLPNTRNLDFGATEGFGLKYIDHVVGNQEENCMKSVVEWYEKIMGFHQFWSADDKDIMTEYSSLRSIVVSNENDTIKIPINEPAPGLRKSQIQEFIDYYKGPGVQHIAMFTDDIIATLGELQSRGVEFLKVPRDYYEEVPGRVGEIDEDLDVLADLGILVDRDEQGYLLQIFTQPVQDRPTLFYEIIQRKGSQAFGKGNFKALFEAIERQQKMRGNL